MEVRGFQPQDLYALSLQREQIGLTDTIRGKGYGEALAAAGPAFTATLAGDVVACIGVIPQWEHYHRAWALLSPDAGRCMVPLTRRISRWLKFHNEGRVDTAVAVSFLAGQRWAEMLGFVNETPEGMKNYKDGRAFYLYAQVT